MLNSTGLEIAIKYSVTTEQLGVAAVMLGMGCGVAFLFTLIAGKDILKLVQRASERKHHDK